MRPTDQVLVVVDPTMVHSRAIERAAWLAEQAEMGLELFLCESDTEVADETQTELLAADAEVLEGIARIVRSTRDIPVTTDVRWHRPLAEGIVRKTLESSPSVVVKDTHRHSLLKRTLLSNTDRKLIRECPSPLLLVKDRPLSEPVKLLAAVDPTRSHDDAAALDIRILGFTKTLRAATDADYVILHVFDQASVPNAIAPFAPETLPLKQQAQQALADDHRREHVRAFSALLAAHGIDESHATLVDGEAGQAVLDVAETSNTDFVVMGAVPSDSLLKDIFVGHVAERVLEDLPCDLVVIKPSSRS